LAISKRLAGILGGDILVRSSPGQGSTFSATIATGCLDDAKIVDRPAAADPHSLAASDQEKLNCRILLAEDGPDNQRLIAFLLRKAGAEVALAEDGQIALNLALAAQQAGNPFDVILMDMQMPVVDGYEATRRLRTAGHTKPIIALTAHAMSDDRQKCLGVGCDDYIAKPIDRPTLLETVAKCVNDKAELQEATVSGHPCGG
jgi:CheY-like chemotaxis protein